jgi:uncharacterized membrane protein YhhN
MIPGSLLFFVVAALDWLAVARGWKRVEVLAKPGAMLVLLGLLGLVGGFGSIPLVCFFLGICLSLAGDVCLLLSLVRFSNRWFLPGLTAFLLAHLAYIVGLNSPLPTQVSPFWLLVLAAILALSARRVLRSILAGVRQKGLPRLLAPVAVYGTVITLMLFSAMLTLSRSDWKAVPAVLVGLGAMLFYASDVLLAWNKFVSPIQRGRLYNMILYHLGQFGLVAGIILQFGK